MSIFTDAVTATTEKALAGVSLRQKVTANNIANMATPGFKASRVDFESDLAAAVAAGQPDAAQFSLGTADTPVGPDGNNVSLDAENSILVKSGLQYDALVAALNYKFATLRIAITGQ